MKLNKNAEVVNIAKKVYTHLGISAHQDDIEFMCPDGIVNGYKNENNGFVAVVTSDGAGSPRAGKFANMTDDDMKKVRRLEQIEAAKVGKYAEVVFLNYTSAKIKGETAEVVDDYVEIIKHYQPKVVYTHNLADKHPTHIGVVLKCIEAIRKLPKDKRPQKLYGCEVWRALDWLNDDEKVIFDLTGYEELLLNVMKVYESQIEGGKRYDRATAGRRYANATYAASHDVDVVTQAAYAMDLTPLILDDTLDVKEFILNAINRFAHNLCF